MYTVSAVSFSVIQWMKTFSLQRTATHCITLSDKAPTNKICRRAPLSEVSLSSFRALKCHMYSCVSCLSHFLWRVNSCSTFRETARCNTHCIILQHCMCKWSLFLCFPISLYCKRQIATNINGNRQGERYTTHQPECLKSSHRLLRINITCTCFVYTLTDVQGSSNAQTWRVDLNLLQKKSIISVILGSKFEDRFLDPFFESGTKYQFGSFFVPASPLQFL